MTTTDLALLLTPWTTDVLPSLTTLTHIDPTHISGIIETLYSLSLSYPTVTNRLELYHMLRDAKGAMASLSVISAQNYIATATETQLLPQMTQVIWNSTMELQQLELGFNLYQMQLLLFPNLVFALVFALVLLIHIALGVWRKHVYFSVCMSIGVALESAGYVSRILLIGNYSDKSTFLCQIITLTLAPAFVMAGVYFLLAQLLVVHGRKFLMLRPLWFSYIFIFCDLLSLAIQAGGGGTAAIKLQNLESTKTGTHVMVSGIAFQVLSMLLFLFLLANFLFRIYFRADENVKFSLGNLARLLFHTKGGKQLRDQYLHQHYNQKYEHIWSRRSFAYYPLVLILSVFFIYVRCVYRLVELSEGWSGYLITHEVYVMTLDALMVLVTCLLLIPFHPGFMMGANTNISVLQIKHEEDVESTHLDVLTVESFPYEEKADPFRVAERLVSDSDSSAASSPRMMEDFRDSRSMERDSRSLERDSRRYDSEYGNFDAESPRSFHAFVPSIANADFVSVPYETTCSTPIRAIDSHKRSHKTHGSLVQMQRTSNTHSFNPYERNLTHGHHESLASYGPYELYGKRERESHKEEETRQNPFETPENPFADVNSQFSNDEDLFEFK